MSFKQKTKRCLN